MNALDRVVVWLSCLLGIATLVISIVILQKVSTGKVQKAAEVRQPQQAPQPSPEEPSVVSASIDDDPIKGSKSAPVIILEFSDFQCPYCRMFAQNTLPQITEKYVKTGKAMVVFRDLPLPFHNFAMDAAIAAECAGRQGKFWEMHDKLFSTGALGADNIKGYAKEIGLKSGAFEECQKDGSIRDEIQKDANEAANYGIRGTPSFIIGKNEGGKTFKGEVVKGAQPYPVFESVIEKYLK